MKKRIGKMVTVLLALCLTLGLIPASAFAAPTEYALWVNDEQITSEHLSVTCGGGTAEYNPTDNVLILNNADITKGCSLEYLGSGILSRIDGLTIVLMGTSTITNTGGEGISTYELDSVTYNPIAHDLTITGGGTITITQNTPMYGYGIYATGDLTVDNVIMTLDTAASGLHANGQITIDNSTLDITLPNQEWDNGAGVKYSFPGILTNTGDVTVSHSILTVEAFNSAVAMGGDTVLNSGTVNLTSYNGYGIEGNDGLVVGDHHLKINGGTLIIGAKAGGSKVPVVYGQGAGTISGDPSGSDFKAGTLPNQNPISLPVWTIESAADLDYVPRDGVTATFTPDIPITVGTLNPVNGDGVRIDYYNPMQSQDTLKQLDSGYTKVAEYMVQIPMTGDLLDNLPGKFTVPLPKGYDGSSAKILGGGMAISSTADTVTFQLDLTGADTPIDPDHNNGLLIEYKDAHTHSHGSEWMTNATHHWHECSCGDKADLAPHTESDWIVDREATASTAGTRHQECTVCGYVMQTETISATGSNPKTGDGSTMMLWTCLAAVVGISILGSVVTIKKRKHSA